MITGRIDENLEARIVLPVVVGDTTTDVELLLDTGFSGFLAVSALLVQQCDLPLRTVQRGLTADGRVTFFDTVDVRVIWNRKTRLIRAQVLDEALIGTRLLAGHSLQADWITGGEVRLDDAFL